MNRHRLMKTQEYPEIWAQEYQIEGTTLFVLELMGMGFAYSSFYFLLFSTAFLKNLNNKSVVEAVLQRPSNYGKKLEFGSTLERDSINGDIYFIGDIEPTKQLP